MDYFKQMNSFEKKLYENGVGGEILQDPYVKTCTTTTTYLAEKLKEYGKKVFIIPNKLSKSDIEICEGILANCHPELVSGSPEIPDQVRNDNKIKLGYFSGTISHNKDFAVITDALMTIMEKYPQVELFLAGPLDIENKLHKFKDRIKQIP